MSTPTTQPLRAVVALLVLAITVLALAPSAAAAPFDEIEIVELDDVLQPDLPIELDLLDDIVVPLPRITATAAIDCGDGGAIDVEIGNPTPFATLLEVRIDGDVVATPLVSPDTAWVEEFPAPAENSTVDVVVEATTTVLDVDLDVDCIGPDPWFAFIADCAVGQAWVELGNHGPDVAVMGVRYDDLPHAPGLVLPGTSTVQPLAVEPNAFVAFAIEVDGEPIHTDGYSFDCPVPEPEPTPAPAEPTPAPAEPTVDAQPGGSHGGTVDETPQPADTDATPQPVDADPGGDTAGQPVPETGEVEIEAGDTGVTGADEVALAAGLEGDGSSVSPVVLIGLAVLFTVGMVLIVGSVAAMRLSPKEG